MTFPAQLTQNKGQALADTSGIIQIRSTPIRLRREMQFVGFLTPIEIEHAVLIAGNERKKVTAALVKDGYEAKEIDRAITAAVKHGHLERPDAKHLGLVPSRREQARRYVLLDMGAIEGKPFALADSSASGLVLVPGYGPFHGLASRELREKAEAAVPALKTDWSVGGVFDGDLAWLAERGYVVVNS
jgi:hypothetical protein